MVSEDIARLLRKLDRQLLSRGFHDDADTALFYIGRAPSGRLYTDRARLPSLDHHPDLVPTELLLYIAREAAEADALPIRHPGMVGLAWTMEAFQASIDKNAPLHVQDQFQAAQRARELDRWDGAIEVRIISAVLSDGTEGGLIRQQDGEVWMSLGQQYGLVYRALRILCGLPEDDPAETDPIPTFERVQP